MITKSKTRLHLFICISFLPMYIYNLESAAFHVFRYSVWHFFTKLVHPFVKSPTRRVQCILSFLFIGIFCQFMQIYQFNKKVPKSFLFKLRNFFLQFWLYWKMNGYVKGARYLSFCLSVTSLRWDLTNTDIVNLYTEASYRS